MNRYLSEEDEQIRKKWLWLTIFLSLIYPFLFCTFHMFYKEMTTYEKLIEFATCFYHFVPFYVIYYCAYKKPGIKLLIFEFVLSVIALPIVLVAMAFFEIIDLDVKIGSLITLPISGAWLYYSYYLIQINKKVIQHVLNDNPDYRNGIEYLKESVNLEDLKIRFSKIVLESPEISFAIRKDFKRLCQLSTMSR